MQSRTLLLSAFLFFSCIVTGQVTWQGAFNADWSNDQNWDSGTAPTASDDVIIPDVAGTPFDPIITTAEVALSVTVDANASLTLASGSSLTIDGTTGTAITNNGNIVNSGDINLGLNSIIDGRGIFNIGNFTNDGNIITDQVGIIGAGVIRNLGTFTNNGLIDIPSPNYFGIVNIFGGNITNTGTITIVKGSDAPFRNASIGTTLDNFGTINLPIGGLRVTVSAAFTNHPCAELFATNIFNDASVSVINDGFMSFTASATSTVAWINNGVVHTPFIAGGAVPINNNIIITNSAVMNTCGYPLSPIFLLATNPICTLNIYTDAAATTSAGVYNIATNTFTPASNLPVGAHNYFVKVECAGCPDQIVTWRLNLNSAPTEVTQTGDSGIGSLRCAINQANTLTGTNTITFNISGTAPHIIQLNSDLPAVTDALTIIDATSQPSWSMGDIVVDGQNYQTGIQLYATSCVIDGIHFDQIADVGVLADNQTFAGDNPIIQNCIFSNIDNTAIELLGANNAVTDNCLIGTNAPGTADQSGTAALGISATAANALMITNCTISGYDGTGNVGVYLKDCSSPTVENCLIGTDALGINPIPNSVGIQLTNTSNFIIQQNIISNNTVQGILVD